MQQLGFGSGADVVASIGKKQRELEGGFVASRTDKYAGFDSEIGCNAAGRVLDKDGGEFNTVGKQGAHDYSATAAGRFILEEKRKFEAMKRAMSETKVRDADGTVDRIDDSVAQKLMPILFTIKERCRTENIELEGIFQEAGGTHFGTIKRQNFQSTLVNNFQRLKFEEETLIALVSAYGCGYQHPPNPALNIPPLYESVGWKDFCEDVGKSYDTSYGVASEIAQLRASHVRPIELGMRADLVEGWDPSSAAPCISLSDSPDTQQNRRPTHPPLENKMGAAKTGRDQYGEMLLDFIGDAEMKPAEKHMAIIRMLDQAKNLKLEVYEDDECSTPLMEAAASGQTEIVKLLIEKILRGFKKELAVTNHINCQDNLGQTALSEAKRFGFPDIAKLLIAAGAK